MTKKEKAKIQATLDMWEDGTLSGRRELILGLMRQQKRLSNYQIINKDNCTLIDLEKGLIVGSGICPICTSFMGRADGYTVFDD
jgi:hypothetical protein